MPKQNKTKKKIILTPYDMYLPYVELIGQRM